MEKLILPYRAHVGRYDCTCSHVEHRGYLFRVEIGPIRTVITATHRQIIH